MVKPINWCAHSENGCYTVKCFLAGKFKSGPLVNICLFFLPFSERKSGPPILKEQNLNG